MQLLEKKRGGRKVGRREGGEDLEAKVVHTRITVPKARDQHLWKRFKLSNVAQF